MEEREKYEMFRQKLMEAVKREFPSEYLVETHKVVKNNGYQLESLTIRGTEREISPNFYLNQLFEKFQQGYPITEIAREIARLYQYSVQECDNMKINLAYEYCKDKIVLRLVSGVWNQEILEQVPYIPFMDMVILFYVVLRVEEEGIGSVRISNQLQEQWSISTKSLFILALENSKKIFPEKICNMVTMLGKGALMEERQEFMDYIEGGFSEKRMDAPYIITNSYGINGASAILYPDILRKIGEKFGADYYLLPSSIHEMLAIPCYSGIPGERLQWMVQEVNRTCVSKEEMLSEEIYYYKLQSGKLSIWKASEKKC